MKLGLIFAACMLVAGCGAAASVDSSEVPNPSADGGTSTGTGDDSATGTSSGDDGSSGNTPDGGVVTGNDSGSSSGGDDGGSSTTADSGSGGGDDGGSATADSGSGGGGGDDGGGTVTADSGSGGGDDGGVTTTDSGSGGSVDSGSGGDDGGGSTSSDGGTTTTDSGSGGSVDSGSGGTPDAGSSTDSGSSDSGSCHAPKCVLTQGYYKNHSSSWTVLPVTMGTNDYSESQCLTLLNDPSVGDASLILAKQYIAAVENGGLCDPNASATMAQAEQWFTDNQNGALPYGISLPLAGCASDHTSVPCQAYWLGQSLDSYNNGLSGTPACQ